MKYLASGLILLFTFIIGGCGVEKSASTSEVKKVPATSQTQAHSNNIDQTEYQDDIKRMLTHFEQKFPNSPSVDYFLVDIDNDGQRELLIALNTYIGAGENDEAAKNGFDVRHVAIVFPRGKYPTDQVSVLSKSVPKGLHFSGKGLFSIVREGQEVDRVLVRMVGNQGKEEYFTLKVEVDEDGNRVMQ